MKDKVRRNEAVQSINEKTAIQLDRNDFEIMARGYTDITATLCAMPEEKTESI